MTYTQAIGVKLTLSGVRQVEYDMSPESRRKLKLMVVDDDRDNLDLLYQTFINEFQVYRADSGLKALEILEKEGEIAIVIFDQQMPEMKGTEFLEKTVEQFPDTIGILLTEHSDLEDLVEAINASNVFKCYVKPWTSTDLMAAVEEAAFTYKVIKKRRKQLADGHSSWCGTSPRIGHLGNFEKKIFSKNPPNLHESLESCTWPSHVGDMGATVESDMSQGSGRKRRHKLKLMVVDDDPDKLAYLYKTFRRDFQVYRADSGIKALEVLEQEGEMAIVIYDQQMPKMKGTEFLEKMVELFPDTIGILLIEDTDVEDLVDAINAGKFFKCHVKHWDRNPNWLIAVVRQAAETYKLIKGLRYGGLLN